MNIKINDGSPGIYMRPYSISSPPSQKNEVHFTIKVIPEGRASTWLNTAQIGTETELFGPIGNFLLNEKSEKDVIFVATGTGIAPFKSMLMDKLEKSNKKEILLIWGLRYEKDIFYNQELQELSKKFPNFRFIITISRPENSWTGASGRVTDLLAKKITDFTKYQYYICGIGEMVKDVDALLSEKGAPKEDIHFEQYT